MRKIYSLVLLAAALLVGTNAWAEDVVGNDRAALQSAINGVTGKQTVTLTLQNNITLDGPIWLGTEYLTDTQDDYAKSIILDLNGHSIEMVGTGSTHNMFVLTRGELLVRNSSATESQIILSGSSNDGSQIFSVYGSYRSSRWNADGTSQDGADSINTRTRGYVSHLEIGERVKIIAAANCLGAGIVVDALFADKISCAGWAAATYYSKTLHYFTNVFGSNHGFAYGVRVDLYGDIEMIGISSGTNKAYGIKVNGCIRSPKETQENKPLRTLQMDGSTNNYLSNYDARREGHKLDTIDVPFVYVHNTAKVQTNSGSTKSAAIYASGYAKWLIEGHCEGNIGVSVSSGSVELHDAVVVSTAENYEKPNGGGSVSGSGSAVVVNSRTAYAGDINVTITGDTKVAADAGYAIEELVNTTADTTKVETITIEGGTIEGGDKGAIIVSEETVENPATDVTVYGGNISGNVAAGTGNITDILPDGGSSTTAHVTTVTDPATGKTTIVVSEGAAPTGQASISAIETAYDESTTENRPSIKVTGSGDLGSFTKNIELKELELNLMSGTPAVPVAQICTIPNGITLTVGRVVMGTAAKIIVEPGGKFIVKGDQGIVAPSTSNIILKTNETTPAEFLFKPSVSSNRHPNATVQLIANSYTSATNPSADYRYQRFGVPTHTALKGLTAKNPSTNTDVQMFVRKYENNGWLTIGYINVPGQSFNYSKMNDPFGYYILQCNVPEVGTLVSMSGELVGNVDASLTTGLNSNGWSTFTNSYSAKLNMLAMMDMFAGLNVASSAAIYFQTNLTGSDNTLTWGVFNLATIHFDDVPTELNPMQAFLIKDPNVTVQSMNLNYNTMVWEPATGSEAPQRAISNLTKMAVKVYDDANIQRDAVYMLQADQFSEDMDQGYDAVKYMNENINLYVMNDERLVTMATDNLAGHYLGFSCEKGGIYTLSFEQLAGDLFTLVDLENNATMDINEGFSYQFEVASNTTDDYRFLIVERQNAPTDLDSVNETVVKENGIYTVTGQYMGNMSVWNTLPAGLYIVNGEKKVK